MLWVKAFHIIFVICWFAGIFYLPRLYVYHAATSDAVSNTRFKTMEKRLYYGIMTPAGILATLFGVWLLTFDMKYYMQQSWMHYKLLLVALLWVYHLYCGHCLKLFKEDRNTFSEKFYRIFNEIPTVILVAVVILVVVKPL